MTDCLRRHKLNGFSWFLEDNLTASHVCQNGFKITFLTPDGKMPLSSKVLAPPQHSDIGCTAET
jgi:hypothetical protein